MPKPTKNSKLNTQHSTLEDYITRYQVDGVIFKADKLLAGELPPLEKEHRAREMANTLAYITAPVAREDYGKKIAKKYDIGWTTFKKIIDEQVAKEDRKKEITHPVRKNVIGKLNGDPRTYPFFSEMFVENKAGNKVFKGIAIDLNKYLELLLSFGFTRYATESEDGFTFVRVVENIIYDLRVGRNGDPEEIKDFILDFIQEQYDFETCDVVDADYVTNFFLDKLKKYFSKDLFARLRSKNEIIINQDTAQDCYLYFQNGFVHITAEGYELIPYEKMSGSVWNKQMLPRKFTRRPLEFQADENDQVDFLATFIDAKPGQRPLGDFADFIWRVCGEKHQRFISLCTILGYLVHDYYQYKLRAIFLTDSMISEQSEGRTGKTLTMQMLGHIRSYAEVNGKQFDPNNERKYEAADRSTQILHINDISHRGKYKFDLESVFNDITEGYIVKQMYKTPFRHRSKMVISSNRSIQVEGSSARDRIMEFEMSSFFHENRSPLQYYERYLGGREWTDEDWIKYDNFLCWCVQGFLSNGLIPPETINLEARKLLDGTCREFVEFMSDIQTHFHIHGLPWDGYQSPVQTEWHTAEKESRDMRDFVFDKKQMFTRFITQYEDWKNNKLSQHKFTRWLRLYGQFAMGLKTITERRSNNHFLVQFKEPVSGNQ